MRDYKNLPKHPILTNHKPVSLMAGFIVAILYTTAISLALGWILWGNHCA